MRLIDADKSIEEVKNGLLHIHCDIPLAEIHHRMTHSRVLYLVNPQPTVDKNKK